MVENNKNKTLFLGMAAASALVGAALLYHYVFADPEEEEGKAAGGIEQELADAKLDVVKKAANGRTLDPNYMIKLLNFVTTTARKRREGDRHAALE